MALAERDEARARIRKRAAAERVEPTGVQVVKADPSDDVYLGTALAGQASYLATFDRRHLLRAIRDRY